jgi:hypothetical protein
VADAKDLAGRVGVDGPYLALARSSADLPKISLLVEWAKAAHLVRTVKGRLVGVESAAGLLDRPLEPGPFMILQSRRSPTSEALKRRRGVFSRPLPQVTRLLAMASTALHRPT